MSKPAHKNNMQVREVKEFDEEVIQIDRVVRVVKGGRRLRFRATVAIGNRRGQVGVGVGKSNEVTGAIQKAIAKAKKTLVTVPIYNGTIPHDLKFKFKSCKLLVMRASPGTGIIAGGPIRKIAHLAGIKNILSKSTGSNNRLNMAQATIAAFRKLQELPWAQKDVIPKAEPKPQPQNNRQGQRHGGGNNRNHGGNNRGGQAPQAQAAPVAQAAAPAKPETKAPEKTEVQPEAKVETKSE